MIQNEGFSSFYRGIVASLFLASHGIIQMMIYEKLKLIWFRTPLQKKESLVPLIIGALSKGITTTMLFPFTVVRTRIQKKQITSVMQKKTKGEIIIYDKFFETFKIIWKNEKLFGFYKGLLLHFMRVVPDNGIFFFTYEKLLKYI